MLQKGKEKIKRQKLTTILFCLEWQFITGFYGFTDRMNKTIKRPVKHQPGNQKKTQVQFLARLWVIKRKIHHTSLHTSLHTSSKLEEAPHTSPLKKLASSFPWKNRLIFYSGLISSKTSITNFSNNNKNNYNYNSIMYFISTDCVIIFKHISFPTVLLLNFQ